MALARRPLVVLAALLLIAAGCRKKGGEGAAGAGGNQVSTRSARLYFESQSMLLVGEPRNLQLPASSAAAIPLVMGELLKGPVNPGLARELPEDTVLRGAYLRPAGTAFVDLGGMTLSRGWATGSHQEMMAVYSVVQTVCANFPDVKRVRLLINGMTAETLGGHVAIDHSLHTDATLVDPRFR